MAAFVPKNGMRVEVIGKGLIGTVSYVGMTAFAAGKWIGVALDEAKGKNDGSVQGKKYFECPPNHGIFVRQTQITELVDDPKTEPVSPPPSSKGIKPPNGSGLKAPGSGIKAPGGSGMKPPGGSKVSSPSPPPQSPSPRGIPARGGTISPPTSGLAKPKGGLQKPGSGLKAPATPSSKTGVQKPSGLQKPGLKGPATPAVKSEQKIKEEPVDQVEEPPKVIEKEPEKAEPPALVKPEVKEEPAEPEPQVPAVPPAHKVVAASEELLDLQRKLMEKEKSVVDLEEKLNVLKQKRIADLGKLKEVDKLKLQNEQFMEYKTKYQESMRDLQNQLRQAQNEAREAADKMSDESDVTELQEAVEMATLDKEMAEEKFESLTQEHDVLKDKFEETSLELEILKNEISEGGVESVQANAQTKQMEQQNIRLKEALLKLKDIAQNDKAELASVTKQNKELSQQVSTIGGERDKLQERLQEAIEQVDDLKEQVDMALGAEEMVEKLTDKNLDLEEKIEQLEESVQDLEALRELNIELEESHVQTEHDLREELDMADSKIRELERTVIANIEQTNDYQETIRKFRELVQQLQGRIKDLHEQSSDSLKIDDLDTTPVPEIDVKTKIAETKQHGRVIELELNKYYVREANKKIEMVNAFLPEHFTKRGADFDGICLLMLFERLEFKCKLLANQLHEKHNIGELVEAGQPLEGLEGDQASHGSLFAYHLINLQLVLSQFLRALNACDVNTFTIVSGQYPELAAHEKILDTYIDFLQNDRLDDTVSVEVLEKTVENFKNFYKLNLASAERDCTDFLSDSLCFFQHGADAVAIDVQRLKGLAKACDEGSVFLNLVQMVTLKNIEIKQLCRKIKRRMIQDSNTTLSYPVSVTQDLLDSMVEQMVLAKYVQDLASVLSLKAGQLQDEEVLLSGHLEESSQDCITMIYEKDGDPLEILSESFQKVLMCLSGIAIKLPEGEYDTEPEKKPTPPYLERAVTFKEELSSTTKLENKIDQKQYEVNEVKKSLKAKSEELSEANIRISLLEKRADNATKEATTKVEQMSKRLEGLQEEYLDKTRQSEKTMDALQHDVDELEVEKTDLKKKLEIYSKKSKLDYSALSQPSAAMASIVAPGKPGSTMASLAKAGVAGQSMVQVVLKDSPVFLAQLDAQKKSLQTLQKENWALKCQKMKSDLAKIPKPYMPKVLWRDGKFVPNPLLQETGKKGESEVNSKTVMKECTNLMTNVNNLVAFPKIVDITKGKKADGKNKPSANDQLTSHLNIMNTLIQQKDQLSKKVQKVIANELPGSSIESDLRTFYSPEYVRMKKENESPIHIATIRLPKRNDDVKPGIRKVTITTREFSHIHEMLTGLIFLLLA
uniref:Dynactin subunit 1 n=1 Tax=Clytia hemisphaerica TaxID=252671 RepID=A0A7M6DIX7_9CNID